MSEKLVELSNSWVFYVFRLTYIEINNRLEMEAYACCVINIFSILKFSNFILKFSMKVTYKTFIFRI